MSVATDFDLDSMTNEELENICTSRGFELVKETDPSTGAERQYSKEDFLEAARQCLEIEAEMEDLLEKHPELVEEIKVEAEKMKLEQEALEKELAAIKSDIDHSREMNSEEHHQGYVERSIELEMIELWLKEEGLNIYGDSEGTMYLGGNPLFDEQTGTNIERLDYLRKKFPQKPWTVEIEANHSGYIDTDTVQDKEGVSNETKKAKLDTADEKTTKAVSKKPDQLLTLHDLMNELQTKVKHDITFVIDLIMPKHLQEPLKEALTPVFRIIKGATLTTYDMVKRYTLLIVKEIQNQSDEERSKSESVVPTAE